MQLRVLPDKGATVAWSPFASQPSLIVHGTKEGGGGGFDDYGGALEFTRLNFAGEPSTAATVKTATRFTSLAWGKATTCSEVLPLGLIAGGMADGVVNVWDAGKALSGEGEASRLSQVEGHEGAVRSVQFNPTATSGHLYASGGSDSKVHVVNLQAPATPTVAAPDVVGACAEGHPREITSVAWNSQVEHILATATQSGTCLVWDLRTNKPWCRLRDAGRAPYSGLAWNPSDGLYLVTATDDDVNPLLRLWDLRSNTTTPLAELRGHTKGVLGVSWCAQDTGLLLSCGKDNRTLLWDMQTGQMLHEMGAGEGDASGAPAAASGGLMGGGGLMPEAHAGAQSLFGSAPSAGGGLSSGGAGRRYEVHWSPCMPGLVASCSFDRTVAVHSLAAIPGEHASRAPKWMRRPAGASFGFGSKLITFSSGAPHVVANGAAVSRQVHVSYHAGDAQLADASAALEAALAANDIAGYCDHKAATATDADDGALWSFLRILFDEQPRHKLLAHLGHSSASIQAEVEAYAAKHGVKLGEDAAPPPAASPPLMMAGGGGVGSPHSASGTTAADVFGSAGGASAADVFGAAPEEASKAEAAPPAAEEPAPTPSPAPPATPPAAAAGPGATPAPVPSFDAEGNGLLRRALLVGDFESAVKCCFAQRRLADALLLAACGSEDLWATTKEQYFKMMPSRFTRMVSAITTSDLGALVDEQPLGDWRETLALLATFAKTDEFAALCEQLGDRLAASGTNARSATLCYICAMNTTKTISSWVEEVAPRASAVGFSVAVHEFVEKVTVFRQGVAQSDAGAQHGEAFQAEAPMFSVYCNMLANQGLLDVAGKYAATIRPVGAPTEAEPTPSAGAVEGEFLRARIHAAYGGDVRTLPLPWTQVEPSPEVTGVQPVAPAPAADAGGYDPSTYAYNAAAGGQAYAAGQTFGAPAGQAAYGYAAPAPAPAAAAYTPATTAGYTPATTVGYIPATTAGYTPATTTGYTPASAAGYPTATGGFAPAPAPAPAAATPLKALSPDGFVTTVGNPHLAQKYGNVTAAPPPAAPAPAPAAPIPIPPATQAALDTFLALAAHLEGLDLSGAEKRMIGEGKKSVATLSSACSAGTVDEDTQGKLSAMAGACATYDFKAANAVREQLVNSHWNEYKDWLKGLKHLVGIGLKKYPPTA